MFILNNIYDRDYCNLYPSLNNPIFDISDDQLKNVKNADWFNIDAGSIVCVVKSSRKVSTFYRVTSKERVDVGVNVLTGEVVAKMITDKDMSLLFNEFGVENKYLLNNKFSNGFNVANLGAKLDKLLVKTKDDTKDIGFIKRRA